MEKNLWVYGKNYANSLWKKTMVTWKKLCYYSKL